jgi:arylsulfatase A-like enzyme
MGHETLLAEFLMEQGFITSVISQILGINRYLLRGYERIDHELSVRNADFMGKTSAEVTKRAIAEIERLFASDRPFYLWIQYFDPHVNHLADSDAPFQGAEVADLYRQEVWQTDREIGRLLRHLENAGYFEKGSLALTADHGELIGERGNVGHAFWLDEEVLRVPILLRTPNLSPAEIDVRVSTVDLLTTLTELTTGISLPTDGRSLIPIARGEDRHEPPIHARAFYNGKMAKILSRAIIDGDDKFVQDLLTGVESLHDLRDPEPDAFNLIDESPDRAESLFQLMGRQWDRSMNDRVAERKFRLLTRRQLSPSEIEESRLETLRVDCLVWTEQTACEQLERLGVSTAFTTP